MGGVCLSKFADKYKSTTINITKKIIRGRSVTSFLNVKFWTEFKIKFPAMLLLPRLPTSVGSVPLLRHPGHGDRVQGLLRQVLLRDQRVVQHVGGGRPQAAQHHHHHAWRGRDWRNLSQVKIQSKASLFHCCSQKRCNGKVFHNERVPTKGKAYHKR